MRVTITIGCGAHNHGDEYVVFARTPSRGDILITQFLALQDRLPRQWAGEDWELFKLFGSREQLRNAIERDEEGLGLFDERTGWTIIPPFEPLGPLD